MNILVLGPENPDFLVDMCIRPRHEIALSPVFHVALFRIGIFVGLLILDSLPFYQVAWLNDSLIFAGTQVRISVGEKAYAHSPSYD